MSSGDILDRSDKHTKDMDDVYKALDEVTESLLKAIEKQVRISEMIREKEGKEGKEGKEKREHGRHKEQNPKKEV